MSLNDYLAKHYGSSSDKKRKDKKSERKSKKPKPTYGMNVVITDDDDSIAGQPQTGSRDVPEKTKPAAPRFKEAGSSWRTVQPARALDDSIDVGEDEQPVIAEGAELLVEYKAKRLEVEKQQRADERARRREAQQQQQQRLKAEQQQTQQQQQTLGKEPPASRSPSPAARFGLQTAQSVKEDADREHARRMRRMRLAPGEASGRGAETVHRDPKTGRVVDADRLAREEQELARRNEHLRAMHREWNKGVVQQQERAEEQRRLERVRATGVVDYGSELDDERRARVHWNDPARMFLENSKGKDVSRYPVYTGHVLPNRFGIRPGYRWDGVDRSNGFEKDMFKSQASSSARQAEDYSHAVADL